MDAEFREEYEKIGAILGITRVLSRLLNVGETCETLKHSSDLIEEVPLPRHFARQPAANLCARRGGVGLLQHLWLAEPAG